jgi:hypothetical protein
LIGIGFDAAICENQSGTDERRRFEKCRFFIRFKLIALGIEISG